MKTQRVVRILSVLLLAFLTFAGARPAYADTHYQDVIDVGDSWVWYGDDNPCGFDLTFGVSGNLRINYWLDENDELTHKIEIFGNIKADVSANGKTVKVQSQGPINWEFSDGMVIAKTTGPTEFVTVPGYGKVFGFAGLLMETWLIDPVSGDWINYHLEKWAGNFKDSDWGPICEYLGP